MHLLYPKYTLYMTCLCAAYVCTGKGQSSDKGQPLHPLCTTGQSLSNDPLIDPRLLC